MEATILRVLNGRCNTSKTGVHLQALSSPRLTLVVAPSRDHKSQNSLIFKMAKLNNFFVSVFVVAIVVNIGDCGVSRESKEKSFGQLTDWKDKLSQVLDTESQELQILHNLVSQSESEIKTNQNDLPQTNPISPVIEQSQESVAALREHGIISKLEENSQRMDGMVIFLSDLKAVLSEAIDAQTKQMNFETEVTELREEVETLRNEMHRLRRDQTLVLGNKDQEHKIQNDEKTIEWLTTSVKELRKQVEDVSNTCNATALLQIQQNMEQHSNRQHKDLKLMQEEIQGIQLKHLKQDQEITEVKSNIEDVRSWQANIGQKIVDGQLSSLEDSKVANNLEEEEHFLTESLKEASSVPIPHGRHTKKLKAKLREISKATKTLAKDHEYFSKRLEEVERQQKNSQGSLDERPTTPAFEKRLSTLEDSSAQYALNLQNVEDKVNVINELQATTSQVFSILEELESRYDEKLTDIQTNLAKMEVTSNTISNTNDELKEHQKYHNGIVQSLKKEMAETKGHLQKNNFRLASLQTQVLKWSSERCSLEDGESIQNIRISTLESLMETTKLRAKRD